AGLAVGHVQEAVDQTGVVGDEEVLAVGAAMGQRAAHPAGDALGVGAESEAAGDSGHGRSPFEGDDGAPRSGRSTGAGTWGASGSSPGRADGPGSAARA